MSDEPYQIEDRAEYDRGYADGYYGRYYEPPWFFGRRDYREGYGRGALARSPSWVSGIPDSLYGAGMDAIVGLAYINAPTLNRILKGAELKLGMMGDAVRYVRERLGLPPSEFYDEATKAAVEKFQLENFLRVDGIVGKDTLPALTAAPPRPRAVGPAAGSPEPRYVSSVPQPARPAGSPAAGPPSAGPPSAAASAAATQAQDPQRAAILPESVAGVAAWKVGLGLGVAGGLAYLIVRLIRRKGS